MKGDEMMNIKIIFFDIDGTLIDMKKKIISEKVLETLLKLKNNGIKICIATGRSPMQVPHFPNIEFDTFLTYNGSYCFNRHKTIFSTPLMREDVYTIIQNAKRINRPLSLATKSKLAANGEDEDLREYYGFGGLDLKVSSNFDDIAQSEDIFQIMMGCRPKDYPDIMRNVKKARITAWWERAVDIIPVDGGKGMAVSKILEYYHLSKEEAMAFGDGNNDIEMLQSVGAGIAMQNASPELKNIADDICGDVAQDGIYYYCKKHGLI